MKLSIALLSLLTTSAVKGQGSQPECQNYTDVVFDANPAIEPAEEAYIAGVAGAMGSNCINLGDGTLKSCDISYGQSTDGDKYASECMAGNGIIWYYDFQPLCNSSVSQTMRNVAVCASKDCLDIGVSNLVPDSGLLAPFEELIYTCGTGSSNLRSAASSQMSIMAALLCIGSAAYFFM